MLQAAAVAAVAGSLVLSSVAPVAAADNRDGRAKNVILLIGDGMGQTHVDATRIRDYGVPGG